MKTQITSPTLLVLIISPDLKATIKSLLIKVNETGKVFSIAWSIMYLLTSLLSELNSRISPLWLIEYILL